jgi:hypothetical protein
MVFPVQRRSDARFHRLRSNFEFKGRLLDLMRAKPGRLFHTKLKLHNQIDLITIFG